MRRPKMDTTKLLCNHIVPAVDALAPLRWGDPIDGIDAKTAEEVRRLADDAHYLYEKLHKILREQGK